MSIGAIVVVVVVIVAITMMSYRPSVAEPVQSGPICGNGMCQDTEGETCTTCPNDCGVCEEMPDCSNFQLWTWASQGFFDRSMTYDLKLTNPQTIDYNRMGDGNYGPITVFFCTNLPGECLFDTATLEDKMRCDVKEYYNDNLHGTYQQNFSPTEARYELNWDTRYNSLWCAYLQTYVEPDVKPAHLRYDAECYNPSEAANKKIVSFRIEPTYNG